MVDFTQEDIPLIPISLFGVYALARLVATIFKHGKQSICSYSSRFAFRVIFFISIIFGIIPNIRKLAIYEKIYTISPYISSSLLVISLAFLVCSLQDFVCYSNREPTFMKRNVLWLTSPFVIFLIGCQFIDCYASTLLDTKDATIAEYCYEVVFVIYTISLISLPALFFLYEIRKNDFSGSMSCKIYTACFFFFLNIASLIASCCIEISFSMRGVVERGIFIIFSSSKDPIMFLTCFTQDMIDWMLKWLYLDEDAINGDDDVERSLPDPGRIELVNNEVF